MSGHTDLATLLHRISPQLADDIYVFATIPPGEDVPAGLRPVMVFREREGTTLIAGQQEAEAAGLAVSFPCRMITLNVYSSLDAVGFIAAIAWRLADQGIGVNAVSAYFHDHLFVPVQRADEAMALLREMAAANEA